MKKLNLLFAALTLIALASTAMARDPELLYIKAGAAAEANDGSVRLRCGLTSHNSTLRILNLFEVVGNEGYYTRQMKVKKDSDLALSVEKTEVFQREGTQCNYRGHDSWDPDFNCSDDIYGYWSSMVVYMTDATGNKWSYVTKTRMLDVKSDRLNDIEARGLLFNQLIHGCDLKVQK